MKKVVISLTILFFIPALMMGQGFYARVGLGGALGTNSSYDQLFSEVDHGNNSYSITSLPMNLGSGAFFNIAAGYQFKHYCGVELILNEAFGVSLKGTTTSDLVGGWTTETRVYGSMFSIIPTFVLNPNLWKVNPYAHFGIMIGVVPVMFRDYEATRATSTDYDEDETEFYYSGVAVGIQAGAGVEWNLSHLIALNLEVNYSGISYSPKKSKLTESTVDGEDQLGSMTVYQKEKKYVKVLDESFGTTPPQDQPREELRTNFSFSNVGLLFGIKFKFGKK
ncbi:MAG TPA: outer membrane beta-barrel protein [Bacteroidales bacterium]|nr:outer membrane beta-barrel protein [Bacteroidales bacterium]